MKDELDNAVNEAFDAMISGDPDYEAKRDRMRAIFAMADAASESAGVGERISFDTVIVAKQIDDNEDAFYDDRAVDANAKEVETSVPASGDNSLRNVRPVEFPVLCSSTEEKVH